MSQSDFIPVTRIEISPSRIDQLYAGESKEVSATVFPSNATYANNIIWRVAAGGDAYAVEYRGSTSHVKAIRAGYSRLIAEALNTDAEKQPDGNMIVGTWIPVYSQDETNDADIIELSQQSASINIGDTLLLHSVITKDGIAKEVVNASEVTWSTSSAKIATVSKNGLVTGVAAGKVTIKVSVKNNPTKYATCVVTVKGDEESDDPTPSPTPTPSPDPTPQVEAVSISKTEINLNEGDSYELKAVVAVDGEMSVATDSDVYWKSQNARVAIVSSAGVVTAISAGSAIIRATSKKNSAISDTCTVRVSGAVTPSGDDSGSDEPEDVSQIVYPDSLDPETIAVSEAVSIVRKNLDEIGLNDSVMYSENTDNESLDKVIMMTLPEAINEVHLSAPIELLEGTDKKGGPFSSIYVADNVLHFSIANDFLRLVSFQAADSSIVLTDIIPEASPQGRKQLNKYIRGTYDRPFLIGIQGHRRERAFAYYTLKSTAYEKSPANAIKRFSYVERLFYNPLATSYPISSGLKHAVYNHLTGMVLAIYGENQRAEYFFNKAIKNIA